MGNVEIWLLAVGLAMDCLSVSVASGAMLRCLRWCVFLKMAFFFGAFQALMPVVGWLIGNGFYDMVCDYDHWIAFGLLGLLGVKMIIEGLKPEEKATFDPSRLAVVLTLAVATSIDALAVGFTFAVMGYHTVGSLAVPVAVIGFVSFALSVAGSIVGALARRLLPFRIEIAGGLVLIGIGAKILVEHLYGF